MKRPWSIGFLCLFLCQLPHLSAQPRQKILEMDNKPAVKNEALVNRQGAAEVQRLIQQLGGPKFAERQEATRRLEA